MNTSTPRQARPGPDGQWRLDVRGLPPPQPFVAIVRAIESDASAGAPITVVLDRDPLPLYPELAQRGWTRPALSAAWACRWPRCMPSRWARW
ncbi:MAG: DUF2249 domain-containing protein [Burkholderiales bacterium]|nr:DUF2249 domain-containing protein [Burkholderiales bacterium]